MLSVLEIFRTNVDLKLFNFRAIVYLLKLACDVV